MEYPTMRKGHNGNFGARKADPHWQTPPDKFTKIMDSRENTQTIIDALRLLDVPATKVTMREDRPDDTILVMGDLRDGELEALQEIARGLQKLFSVSGRMPERVIDAIRRRL